MKTFSLLALFILCSIASFAQDCGNFIDLAGIGIHGQHEATLTITNGEDADFIVVEAIYKSKTQPTTVQFSSALETINVEPADLLTSGSYNTSYHSVVYKATMKATNQVKVDILNNIPAFYSFAAYAYQPGGNVVSNLSGDLYHVFQNADNPLSLDIAVPVTDESKDVKIRFGISELNDDSRYAIFKFYAGAEMQEIQIQSWDPTAGETDSYTIKEVNFNALPGNIDKIVFTLISDEISAENGEGDSYVAGITILDIPCEDEEKQSLLCSYTQGFYGNKGGKTCSGSSTTDLLTQLLETPLVIGTNNNTLTISNSDCVYTLLPGGGKSASLNGAYDCNNINSILNKKGRLKNTLLAQTITLGLNLRNSPALNAIVLSESFSVQDAEDCKDPESQGIEGSELEYGFTSEIINYLGEGATIADLYDLANKAVGGVDISPLSFSQVSNAATLVNEAFDECKVIVNSELQLKSAFEDESEISSQDIDIMLYPMPVRDHLNIILPSDIESVQTIFILNLNGQIIHSLGHSKITGPIEINNLNLQSGIYFISVYTGTKTITKRFSVF